MNERQAKVERKTSETEIRVRLGLDRPRKEPIRTGVGFFDHMLDALGRHGRLALAVEASGDLHIDAHHMVEDVGIALGTALRKALGADLRIRRFAHAYAPLDDALARAVVDVSGRAYLGWDVELARTRVGDFDTDLVEEFFRAFVQHAALNLHVTLLRGDNAHHQIEAIFKATALALRHALERDPTLEDVPSTKGTLDEEAAQGRS
jgi:imidazoleglycerol-phosphate dehydratase